ncbi:methionyl-tRNA formyltransferase [Pontimonas sp.]|uniref:methionyl-tRNA formyltransferase n=1 Tax=Pontimonas sp. TaxID=2304492 RepID=UPI00286FD9C2|nr:methionyl-tRNA formyltransferase [Pontimonas sp.]MDR9433994.1 methionyl-tRNA formyltransferase [Pontimonas sp.]
MRVVFAGSPEVARRVLDVVRQSGVSIVGVISQPDRPVGRKKTLTATPVSRFATDQQLPLWRPENAGELVDALRNLRPDLVIAVAYGRLITAEALAVPPHGWWNLHFSLLPAHRGATPVQHALLAGDDTTGVSVFQIDEGLDTGPLLGQRSHPVTPGITAGELLGELAEVGATLLVETVDALVHGTLSPRDQVGEATLAPKLPRDAGRLDCAQPADQVFRRYQATTPEPGAYVFLTDTQSRLGISKARLVGSHQATPGVIERIEDTIVMGCGGGGLELLTVHPAGKNVMPATDWWRGVGRPVRCGE